MDELNKIVELYIDDFGTSEDDILRQLTRETAITQIHPRMLSGKYQGHLLSILIKLTNTHKVLEIGTYAGYATICIARALPVGGKVITIEKNDEIEWLSRKYFKLAQLEDKIEAITADALEVIPSLTNDFDVVFLDGDKREYLDYYKISLTKLKKGGLIIADNVLWSNKIFAQPASNDYMTKGILEFNKYVNSDNSTEKIILPIRDGLMLIRKLGD